MEVKLWSLLHKEHALSFFKKLLTRLKGEVVSVGIDIGHSAIRGVKVLHLAQGPVLVGMKTIKSDPSWMIDGEIQKPLEISQSIQSILKDFNVSADEADIYISLGMSPQILTERISIKLPNANMRPLDEDAFILKNASEKPPFDGADIYMNYKVLRKDPVKAECDVLLVAARLNLLDKWVANLKQLDIQPRGLDVDAFATYNAYSLEAPKDEIPNAVALLNVGQYHSFITFVSNGIYHSTRILDRISITQLARALTTKANIKIEDAVEILFGQQLTPDAESLRRSALEILNTQVNQAVHFFQSNTKGNQLKQMYIFGGGASIPGIADSVKLSQRLDHCQATRCLENMPRNKHLNPNPETSHEYAVALGLALRKS